MGIEASFTEQDVRLIEREYRTLDQIERPFTDFDRARWDYTSRERYISAPRAQYPEASE